MSLALPIRGARGAATAAASDPTKHTVDPIVTGSSVLAIKYAGGVMMSADTLASYGSLARFKDVRRLRTVGDHTMIGAGGEYSDFQEIMKVLEDMTIKEYCLDDGSSYSPASIHSYLTRVMYYRRNKMNPYFNSVVLAGFEGGNSFLGTIDNIGTAYEDNFIATGFGAHLALPIIRRRWTENMTEAEARTLLEDCMKVLFYRDGRTLNRMQLAKITGDGSLISDPYSLETKWDYESFVNMEGYV